MIKCFISDMREKHFTFIKLSKPISILSGLVIQHSVFEQCMTVYIILNT